MAITSAPNYREINDSNSLGFLHGTLNASLKLYGKYLAFVNDSEIVDGASKAIGYVESDEVTVGIVTDVERAVITRSGQSRFRKRLLERRHSCELCELAYPQLLIASHIKPWRLSNNYERLDPDNGLVLCSIHDALFDSGFISFDYDNSGKISISGVINKPDYNKLNINPAMALQTHGIRASYMDFHYRKFFVERG